MTAGSAILGSKHGSIRDFQALRMCMGPSGGRWWGHMFGGELCESGMAGDKGNKGSRKALWTDN